MNTHLMLYNGETEECEKPTVARSPDLILGDCSPIIKHILNYQYHKHVLSMFFSDYRIAENFDEVFNLANLRKITKIKTCQYLCSIVVMTTM